MMCVGLKPDEDNIIHVILNTNDQLLNVQMWVLWPSHFIAHVWQLAWGHVAPEWQGMRSFIVPTTRVLLRRTWALCGLLSYLPSVLSAPILTPCLGPGPHRFSLATLTCSTAQTAHPLDRHLEPSLLLAASVTGVQDECNHHVKTHPTGEDA